jgi:hypothetical protein
MAVQAFSQGQAVVPFWGDRVQERLNENLKNFQ